MILIFATYQQGAALMIFGSLKIKRGLVAWVGKTQRGQGDSKLMTMEVGCHM